MPRVCVIVLDAVGAGELPDAAEFGDAGSNTLANVARAVGGLDLPTLDALGFGNIEPLEGCAPQPGAPAIAGRLVERSKGKDTTTGHWELMGVVTPQAMPTYPFGFPDDVIDPFMNRTGRGVIGNKPASGTEIIQELGEAAGDRRRPRLRRAALQGLDVSEAESFHCRQVEATDGAGDVPEGVRPLVTELTRIRQFARSDSVQHDDARPSHAAILLP